MTLTSDCTGPSVMRSDLGGQAFDQIARLACHLKGKSWCTLAPFLDCSIFLRRPVYMVKQYRVLLAAGRLTVLLASPRKQSGQQEKGE